MKNFFLFTILFFGMLGIVVFAQSAVEPIDERNLLANVPSPVWAVHGQPEQWSYSPTSWRLVNVDGAWAGTTRKIKGFTVGETYTFFGTYGLASGEARFRFVCGRKCSGKTIVADDSSSFAHTFVAQKDWMRVYVQTRRGGELLVDDLGVMKGIPEPEPPAIVGSDEAYAERSIVSLDVDAFPDVPTPYKVAGSVYHVETNGNNNADGSKDFPFATLAQAEKKVTSGDMVIVHGGVYKDCVDYDDCYELTFNTPGVVWQAAPGETVTIAPSGLSKRGLNLLGDDIVVDGFSFVGFPGSGIVTTWAGSASAAPTGQVIRNVSIDMKGAPWSDGIGMYGYHNGLRLENVSVKGATLQGITCAKQCNNLRFDNVTIAMDGSGGGSGADGIGIEAGENILITNTEVTGASADGIDVKGGTTAVFDSYVHDIGAVGLKLWRGGDIVGTVVRDTGADAAVTAVEGTLRLKDSLVAYHNRATGARSYSITFAYDSQASMTLSFIDSVVCGNTGDYYASPASTVIVDGGFVESTSSCASAGIGDRPTLVDWQAR